MLSPLGLAIILLAPALAGAGIFALSPKILAAKYGSQATIDTYPIIGTQASYEVATKLANFGTAFAGAGEVAGQASGQSPAEAGSYLTVTRSGDSSLAQVGFQAPTADHATAGLRAAASHALEAMAASDLAKANVGVRAAQAEVARAVDAASEPDAGTDEQRRYLEQARTQRVNAASTALADAYTVQATAQAARRAIPGLVAGTTFSSSQAATTTDALRIALAGALTAFLVATALVIVVRRRHLFGARR